MKLNKLFSVCILALAVAAFAGDQKAELTALMSKKMPEMEKAFMSKNIKWFETNSTSDFQYVDTSGTKQNKKQALAGMSQMFGMMTNIKCTLKVTKIAAANDKGTVDATQVFGGDMVGPDKKKHKLVMKSYSRDSWKKVNGKWMIYMVSETKQGEYTMDGKPIDPSKMMGGG